MRSIENMLAYEAKKKPVVADLVARADALSDEEIDSAPVLPWIKDAVRSLRADKEHEVFASELLSLVIDGVREDVIGEVREWIQAETYVNLDRGGQLLVNPGDIVFLPTAGGVWIDTIFSRNVDKRLSQATKPLLMMRKSEYTTKIRERRLSRYGDFLPETTGPQPPSALSRLGVRFSR